MYFALSISNRNVLLFLVWNSRRNGFNILLFLFIWKVYQLKEKNSCSLLKRKSTKRIKNFYTEQKITTRINISLSLKLLFAILWIWFHYKKQKNAVYLYWKNWFFKLYSFSVVRKVYKSILGKKKKYFSWIIADFCISFTHRTNIIEVRLLLFFSQKKVNMHMESRL